MLSDDTGRFLSFDTEYIMMSLSANKAQEITSTHFLDDGMAKVQLRNEVC